MRNGVFNTTFENMLRILLLIDTMNVPANADRIAALDFICIYGKKCKVLDKNLHGDNKFGFSEFANKRRKITEAIKLSVRNIRALFIALVTVVRKSSKESNHHMHVLMWLGQRLFVEDLQIMPMTEFCNI